MISKKYRFTTALFDKIFRRSKRLHVEGYTFAVSHTPRGQASRFAIVVGKKVSKSAVERNRLRRQLYELVRQNLIGKIIDKNVIFIYKGSVNFTDHENFGRACQALTKKLKNG